jgi:hypothetical protein
MDVVGPIVHRVVRHVDDGIASRGALRQQVGDARHGIRAAVHDAVEVDQQEEAHGAES